MTQNPFNEEILREEFDKWRNENNNGWPSRSECLEWFISKFAAYQTAIIKEIEGMKK